MNSEAQIALGKRIRKCRKDMFITMEELAERAELTYWTISHVERGLMNCSLRVIMKVDLVLNAGLDYLIYGEE